MIKLEETKQKNKFNPSDFINESSRKSKAHLVDKSKNKSLQHRIDACNLHNPLNYNSLNDTANQGPNSFKKRKRDCETEKDIKRSKIESELKVEQELDKEPDISRVKKTKKTSNIPFTQIMKNCRIALSGFVNPERATIRDQAQQMGAEFDRDLTPMTTHLICAFANTPKAKKFNYGFIVKKSWIHLQHATKRVIPN